MRDAWFLLPRLTRQRQDERLAAITKKFQCGVQLRWRAGAPQALGPTAQLRPGLWSAQHQYRENRGRMILEQQAVFEVLAPFRHAGAAVLTTAKTILGQLRQRATNLTLRQRHDRQA